MGRSRCRRRRVSAKTRPTRRPARSPTRDPGPSVDVVASSTRVRESTARDPSPRSGLRPPGTLIAEEHVPFWVRVVVGEGTSQTPRVGPCALGRNRHRGRRWRRPRPRRSTPGLSARARRGRRGGLGRRARRRPRRPRRSERRSSSVSDSRDAVVAPRAGHASAPRDARPSPNGRAHRGVLAHRRRGTPRTGSSPWRRPPRRDENRAPRTSPRMAEAEAAAARTLAARSPSPARARQSRSAVVFGLARTDRSCTPSVHCAGREPARHLESLLFAHLALGLGDQPAVNGAPRRVIPFDLAGTHPTQPSASVLTASPWGSHASRRCLRAPARRVTGVAVGVGVGRVEPRVLPVSLRNPIASASRNPSKGIERDSREGAHIYRDRKRETRIN